jgi:hypothetical protein
MSYRWMKGVVTRSTESGRIRLELPEPAPDISMTYETARGWVERRPAYDPAYVGGLLTLLCSPSAARSTDRKAGLRPARRALYLRSRRA